MSQKKISFPIATALRHSLKNYSLTTLRHDVVAGLVVALVALPLAMALSIAVGLPPRHGLHTAIVAGIVAALLGGSAVQVSGPTAAFVVVVAPIVAKYGIHGLIWCQIMAGFVLVVMGMARIGKIIRFVPHPVVTGFTAGIAVTIGTLALGDFLGLGAMPFAQHYIGKVSFILSHLPELKPTDIAVGVVTLLTILGLPKITKVVPAPAVGIALGTLLAVLFAKSGMPVDTLNTRFSYFSPDGVLHSGVQPYPPSFHLPGGADSLFQIPSYAEFKTLVMPAMIIAALAALESLLSATVADSMTHGRHDPDAELNGIGIANIATGFVAGIPATGAIARTASNIQSGAKTPLAAVFHALFILLFIMAAAPWISQIPMAALAALLLSVAFRMSHAAEFANIIRQAPRSDTVVLLVCFLLTVFIDMVAGVTVGLIIAALLFMKRISDNTYVGTSSTETDSVRPKLPKGAMIYHIEGPLFFGTTDKMQESAAEIPSDVKKLVINMVHVPIIDMTGMIGIKNFLEDVDREGREIIVCGKKHVVSRIREKISGIKTLRHVRFCGSCAEALKEN